MPPIGTP